MYMYIDIMEIWFGIAIGYISSILDSYLPMTDQLLGIIASRFY